MNDDRKIYEQVGDAMFFLPEYAHSSITMTNEKAISEIKGFMRILDTDCNELVDALITALQALEAQPMHGYKIDFFTPTAQAWLPTFNTDSATECFTAVQELKKRLED